MCMNCQFLVLCEATDLNTKLKLIISKCIHQSWKTGMVFLKMVGTFQAYSTGGEHLILRLEKTVEYSFKLSETFIVSVCLKRHSHDVLLTTHKNTVKCQSHLKTHLFSKNGRKTDLISHTITTRSGFTLSPFHVPWNTHKNMQTHSPALKHYHKQIRTHSWSNRHAHAQSSQLISDQRYWSNCPAASQGSWPGE